MIKSQQHRAGRRYGVSLGLVLATLAIFLVPGGNEALALERGGIAAGRFWLLVTGHFTHWNADHLLWDLVTFAVLGIFCESHSRRRFLLGLGFSALVISLGFLCFESELTSYRGLSGLDSALYGLAMGEVFLLGRAHQRWGPCLVAVFGILGFAAKAFLELAGGDALFVAAGEFVPVPGAHLLGFLCGLIVALTSSMRSPSRQAPAIPLREGHRAGGEHRWKRA